MVMMMMMMMTTTMMMTTAWNWIQDSARVAPEGITSCCCCDPPPESPCIGTNGWTKKSTLSIPDLSPTKVSWLKALAVSITRKKTGPAAAAAAEAEGKPSGTSSASSKPMMLEAAVGASSTAWAGTEAPSSQQAVPDRQTPLTHHLKETRKTSSSRASSSS